MLISRLTDNVGEIIVKSIVFQSLDEYLIKTIATRASKANNHEL